MREAVTLVAGWLRDGTDGLAQTLPTVPLAPGDTVPTVAQVVEQYDDNLSAHRRLEQSGDLMVTVLAGDSQHAEDQPVAVGSQRRQGDTDLLVLVDYRDDDGAVAQRVLDYACTAIERTVRRFRIRPPAARTLGSITLLHPTAMARGRGDTPLEDTQATAGVSMTWRFLDTDSEGQP